jgi:hypothetical protein
LSAAGRYHFLYFVAAIFFCSFYLINLILAIVTISYVEQQKKVEAENEERERRKIEDEEERKVSEAHALLRVDNEHYVENSNRNISYSGVSIEYEQNEDRKNQQASGFSYLSEPNQTNNDSAITVKRKYIFILFFYNLS